MRSALASTCLVAASSSSSPGLGAAFSISPSWNAMRSRRAVFSRASMRERSSCSRSVRTFVHAAATSPAASARSAYSSSSGRCASGSSSAWCSCCPCSSTRRAERSRSAAAVASAPLMNDRLRPWLLISRRTISSRALGSSKMASIVASASPVRTRSADARAPSRSPTASTRIDLPAPVSPVRTLNPGSNSTSTASITARLRMRRKRSMHAELQSYHMFDSTQVACYARTSALSQRRAADASEASLHTLGLFVLALQVQDGAAPVSSGSRVLIDIITKATVINQAVLAILIVISVASWAIILSKSLAYNKVQKQTSRFLEAFRKSSKFSEVQAVCATLPASPLVGVFQAGYAELNAQFRLSGPQPANPSGPPPRPTLKSLPAIDRALLRASTVDINKLEQRVPFLATAASVAPFIGLFGTVVGITIAFQRIGTTATTKLAAAEPSISPRPIATAARPFSPISALLAYHHFSPPPQNFPAAIVGV